MCALAENLLSTVAYVTHIRQSYMKLDGGGGVKVLCKYFYLSALNLIAMRGDTFISLSFLDQFLSADFIKNF